MSVPGPTKLALHTRAPVNTQLTARAAAMVTARRWVALISDRWMPTLLWQVQRTGRLGLTGVALLVATVIFLTSTVLPVGREVGDLRSQLEDARARRFQPSTAAAGDDGAAVLRSLPPRARMPALLGVLLKQAEASHLSIDTGKYETSALKSGGVVSYQISFPITGAYPQVRQFIDATLAALPTVGMSELSLTRKSIGDGAVEAQIRLVAFTRDGP